MNNDRSRRPAGIDGYWPHARTGRAKGNSTSLPATTQFSELNSASSAHRTPARREVIGESYDPIDPDVETAEDADRQTSKSAISTVTDPQEAARIERWAAKNGEIRSLPHYANSRYLLRKHLGWNIGGSVHNLGSLLGITEPWDLVERDLNGLDVKWWEYPLAGITIAPIAAKLAAPAVKKALAEAAYGSARGELAKSILGHAAGKKARNRSYAAFRKKHGHEPIDDLYQGLDDIPMPKPEQKPLPRGNFRDATPTRVTPILSDPSVAIGIHETVRRGLKRGGADWYDLSLLRRAFVDEHISHYTKMLGPKLGREIGIEAGEKGFREFVDHIAATSPLTSFQENIKIASNYYFRHIQGKPVLHTRQIDPGYGSPVQAQHVEGIRALAKGGLDPLRHPKRASMRENLLGNEMPVTIDSNFMRLLGALSKNPALLRGKFRTRGGKVINPREMYESGELTMKEAVKNPQYWEVAPSRKEYAEIERWVQQQAKEVGLTPAQFQASLFLGGAEKTGLRSSIEPAIKTFSLRVKHTAKLHGISPYEVLRGFIRGEHGLNGIVAVPTVGAGAAVGHSQWSDEKPASNQDPTRWPPRS